MLYKPSLLLVYLTLILPAIARRRSHNGIKVARQASNSNTAEPVLATNGASLGGGQDLGGFTTGGQTGATTGLDGTTETGDTEMTDAPLVFQWDCTNSQESCQNYCYAAFCKNKPGPYNYDTSNADAKRTAAGTSGPSNCRESRTIWAVAALARYNNDNNDCDEWPPAQTAQGGAGALLRCVPEGDNRSLYSQAL